MPLDNVQALTDAIDRLVDKENRLLDDAVVKALLEDGTLLVSRNGAAAQAMRAFSDQPMQAGLQVSSIRIDGETNGVAGT